MSLLVYAVTVVKLTLRRYKKWCHLLFQISGKSRVPSAQVECLCIVCNIWWQTVSCCRLQWQGCICFLTLW